MIGRDRHLEPLLSRLGMGGSIGMGKRAEEVVETVVFLDDDHDVLYGIAGGSRRIAGRTCSDQQHATEKPGEGRAGDDQRTNRQPARLISILQDQRDPPEGRRTPPCPTVTDSRCGASTRWAPGLCGRPQIIKERSPKPRNDELGSGSV